MKLESKQAEDFSWPASHFGTLTIQSFRITHPHDVRRWCREKRNTIFVKRRHLLGSFGCFKGAVLE